MCYFRFLDCLLWMIVGERGLEAQLKSKVFSGDLHKTFDITYISIFVVFWGNIGDTIAAYLKLFLFPIYNLFYGKLEFI